MVTDKPTNNEELACAYATLILQDDGIPVTADKIKKLLDTAKVKHEPYYPGLFEKFNVDLKTLLAASIGSSAPAAAGAPGGAAPAAGGAPAGAKAEEKKEEKKEEDDDAGMGFDLFD